jgi:hypothetical protein
MLYSYFEPEYGREMQTLTGELLRIDELLIKIWQAILIHMSKLVNMEINYLLEIEQMMYGLKMKFDCLFGGFMVEWISRIQQCFQDLNFDWNNKRIFEFKIRLSGRKS